MTIEERLHRLGDELTFPRSDDLGDDVLAALDRPAVARPASPSRSIRPARLLGAAAVAMVVAGGAVVAVPSTREAAARLLGIGDVRIELVVELPPADSTLGPAISLGAAAAAVGVDPLVAPGLGSPLSVHAPDARYVALRYLDDGVPVLVTTMPGRLAGTTGKQATAGTSFEPTAVGASDALWITGADHTISYVTAAGEPRAVRLSSDVLLWQRGDVIVRVEGELMLPRAREIAESLVPTG